MDIRPIDANVLMEKAHCTVKPTQDRPWVESVVGVDDIDAAPTLSLNTLRDAIYQDAVAHGLWDEKPNFENASAIVGREAIELMEAAAYTREHRDDEGYIFQENWMHFVEELADVVISSFSVAGYLRIDIDAAIRRKMEINKGRPWKHGKEEKA